MSEAADRAPIVRSALEAAVTGDVALVERIYTDDVSGWSPTATASSRADLVADLRGRKGVFSDVDLALDAVDEVGDKVIAEWRLAATHTGALELDDLRLDPTGRRVELRGVLIAEFEGDRIKRFRQYWDEVALLEGLGLLPED
ncbi:MAG TPA: nuclear transport factor 2 family protein [Actinomycetota bacterium]|nr:nuclear transport factor 2 family protein [Actinomycetota bacterium]